MVECFEKDLLLKKVLNGLGTCKERLYWLYTYVPNNVSLGDLEHLILSASSLSILLKEYAKVWYTEFIEDKARRKELLFGDGSYCIVAKAHQAVSTLMQAYLRCNESCEDLAGLEELREVILEVRNQLSGLESMFWYIPQTGFCEESC